MDDVDELIDRCRAKLGEPDGVYRPAPLGRNLMRGVAMLIGGLVVLVLVLVFIPRLVGPLGKILFALPVFGGILIYHALKAHGRAVLTYSDGLLPVGRGEVAWLPWEAVESLQLRAKVATWANDHLAVEPPGMLMNLAKLTVNRSDDGLPVEVRPALIGYSELVARVQKETFTRRWPVVRDQFDAGETVGFGEFDLHQDGLGSGRKTLPWDRVKDVQLKGGRLIVKKRGKWLAWAAVSLEKVADPHLFLALVEHARSVTAAEDESDSPPGPDGV